MKKFKTEPLKLSVVPSSIKKEPYRLSDIRHSLHLPLLSSRRELFFTIKIAKSILRIDDELTTLLPSTLCFQTYPCLRSTDLSVPIFITPRFNKILYGKKSFKYLAPKIWNNLPIELRLCDDINKFKNLAKQSVLRY